MSESRLSVGAFKFCSCDGCQLQLIDMIEDSLALNSLLDAVQLVDFAEVNSASDRDAPLDVAFVEGSISTTADARRIREVRARSRTLVTIGACATSGGIQSLRNGRDHREFLDTVYARPEFIDTLADSTPIADHVPVDLELRGCPVDRSQLAGVLAALVRGISPLVPGYSVCMECKRKGHVCVVVAKGEPCLGPVTNTGCGALCPSVGRGCYGCFGPMEQQNRAAQSRMMADHGVDPVRVDDLLRPFSHTRGDHG